MKTKFLNYLIKLSFVFVIGFLTIQSSFIFQNADIDIYNSFIREGKNDFNQYAISIIDDVNFFEKNDRHFYRDSEPLMFRSGDVISDNSQYTLLETWQLYFENQEPIRDQMYQRIHTWYGTAVGFDDGYNIGMSTELFSKLFPNKDFNEFGSLLFSFEYKNRTIDTKIAFLYDNNIFNLTGNRGKFYKTMFGINCLFANKAIIEDVGFNTLNIVYNQSNYSKIFNYKLFKSFSSNQIETFECFDETNRIIVSNLKLCKDLKFLRIVCLILDVLIISVLVFLQIKKKQMRISKYVFGISYSCFAMLLALLEKITNHTIIISSTGFWFVFFVGLSLLVYLAFINRDTKYEFVRQEIYEISI